MIDCVYDYIYIFEGYLPDLYVILEIHLS